MEKRKEKKDVETSQEKKKKKKVIIGVIIVVLLLVIAFLIYWFNRKFDVTFKYNNGTSDKEVVVKYLKKIKDEDVIKELKLDGYTFAGYYETYKLKGKELKRLQKDESLKDSICKKDFKLNNDKNKCIAKLPYDFKNKKIKKNTVIEALWSTVLFEIEPTSKEINEKDKFTITTRISGSDDTSVKWSSQDVNVATVTENGEVTGIKEGKTIITAVSNGIQRECEVTVKKVIKEEPKKEVKDEGTISLRATDQCMIGNDSVKVIASVSDNAINKKITWTFPDCFTYDENDSGTEVILTRFYGKNSCSDDEVTNPIIKASLNNGNSDSIQLNYEPTLSVKVYDRNSEINPSDGVYYGNRIKVVTNQSAIFTASGSTGSDRISEKNNTSITLTGESDARVRVKTTCGQSISFDVQAVIN